MKKWEVDTPEAVVQVKADRWFVGDFRILYFTNGVGTDTKSVAAFTEWGFVAEDTNEDNAG